MEDDYVRLLDAPGPFSAEDANSIHLAAVVLFGDCEYLLRLLNVTATSENFGLHVQSKIEGIGVYTTDLLVKELTAQQTLLRM